MSLPYIGRALFLSNADFLGMPGIVHSVSLCWPNVLGSVCGVPTSRSRWPVTSALYVIFSIALCYLFSVCRLSGQFRTYKREPVDPNTGLRSPGLWSW